MSIDSTEEPTPLRGEIRGSDERRTLLRDEPTTVGVAWVRFWCDSLRGEGRSVDGGWPGTLQEARARVLQHFDRELAVRGMPSLTHTELEAATTATYERARRDWSEIARSVRQPGQRAAR